MTLFRFHRGALDESMETCVELGGMAQLCRHIRRAWGFRAFKDSDVEVKPYGYDKRIDWDTHVVTISGNAIGFTDGPVRPSVFFNRKGEPVGVLEWAKDFEDDAVRVVADETIEGVRVVTIWIGLLNPCSPPEGAPLIFETMVFGGKIGGEMDRYATETAAVAGHAEMMARVKGMQ